MDRETAKNILISNLPTYLEQKGIDLRKKFNCLCPEHMDNTPSMGYYRKYNICHCFSCGANANIFKVIEWDYNTNSFEETFELACDLFGLEIDDRKAKTPPKIQAVKRPRYIEKEAEKVDIDVCNIVYQAMRDASELSDNDMKYLKEVRHLDETRIKKDYFSIVSDPEQRRAIVCKIKKMTRYSNDVLKNIPGFFLNTEGNFIDYYADEGIGILIRNAEGKAQAVQVRRLTAEKGRRYCWFTSSFALENPKYDGGGSPGAAKDVLIPKHPKDAICITEGRFKAEALAQNGNIVISIQGVSNWKGIDKIVYSLMKKYEISTIYLMFDSDVMGNFQLIHTLNDMAKVLPKVKILTGVWKIQYGKGIDDCIFNGNIDHVSFVDSNHFFNVCNKSISDLMKEYDIKNINKTGNCTRKLLKDLMQTKNENVLCKD